MRTSIRAALALGALLLTACGPQLLVRHRDPTRPRAAVYVDDQRVGVVHNGHDLSIKARRGAHVLRVVEAKSNATPWHPERSELTVLLDDQVTMTLLPDAEPDR